MKILQFTSTVLLSTLLLLASTTSVRAQGVAFRGAGAVNESMGGAATACPLSATGALYWNPATMNAFHGTTVDVDLGIALPESTISSTLPNGVGGGTTESDSGAVPIPNVAIIRHYDDSRWAFGFSFGAVGGARTNYSSASPYDNPILSNGLSVPEMGGDVGYGNLNSSIQILQIAANLSYAVTEKFSVSFGPTLTMGEVSCDPLYVIGNGLPDYSDTGVGNRYVFGGGFQVGFYYDTQMGWSFGGSYKSKGWIEDIEFQTDSGEHSLDLNYPAILSFGACWYGWDKWTFAWDARYFFYEDAGFDQLGWSNMWAFSFGVQRVLNDRISVRAGYSFNENQLDSAFSRANIAVPLIPQHALFLGTSLRLDCRTTLHLTYGHVFKATSSGSYMGPVSPGGDVTISAEADEIVAGISFNF